MATKKSKQVEIDRRSKTDRRESEENRRIQDVDVTKSRREGERRKVPRRRQIDPTTCERDYTDEEIEFMQAMDCYKRANGRMFPTCSEILEVIRDLGYVKVDQPASEAKADASRSETSDDETSSD